MAKYVKAIEFPQGITSAAAATLQKGQYVRLYNRQKVSRYYGNPHPSIAGFLHTTRSGRVFQRLARDTGRA